MDIRFSRGHPDGSESLRALSHPSLHAENRQALGGEGRREKRKRSLSASMPTHCSTERVRLAAKASAMDLAPSSLILLLWRLWKQRGASLMEHRRVPGMPSPPLPRKWENNWPFPLLLWP